MIMQGWRRWRYPSCWQRWPTNALTRAPSWLSGGFFYGFSRSESCRLWYESMETHGCHHVEEWYIGLYGKKQTETCVCGQEWPSALLNEASLVTEGSTPAAVTEASGQTAAGECLTSGSGQTFPREVQQRSTPMTPDAYGKNAYKLCRPTRYFSSG